MAGMDYAPQAGVAEERSSRGIGNAVTVASAILSLTFMGGVGVWGYKLMMRDVSGVPVVRAIEGPMRVAPEDPGGLTADHMGLAVNAVAAQGQAESTPDKLVLAPKPVSLRDEDKPVSVLAEENEAEIQEASAPGDETEEEVEGGPVKLTNEDDIAALVEELTKDVKPLEDLGEGVDTAAVPPDVDWGEAVEDEPVDLTEAETLEQSIENQIDDIPTAVVNAPGLRQSPRPQTRPASLSRPTISPEVQRAIEAATAEVAEVDPSKLAPGTRLAQLGAFDSPEIARDEWQKLSSRFSDYLEGKSRVVQQAASGGRTFYRLRAMGFEDLADARRFCSALVAEGADCIPVVTR